MNKQGKICDKITSLRCNSASIFAF